MPGLGGPLFAYGMWSKGNSILLSRASSWTCPPCLTPLVHTTWKRKRSCHIIDSIHGLLPPFRPLPANINANTIEIEKIIMKNVKYIYLFIMPRTFH